MKVLVVLCIAILCFTALVAFLPAGATSASMSGAVAEGGNRVLASATPLPDRQRFYKSFPAPTGLPAFRKYYQKRCYPGCHYGVDIVTPTPKTKTHPTPTPTIKPTQPRYYKSYPAPTGLPGFRKYYQKRCYPGCHYGDAVITPVPGVVHP